MKPLRIAIVAERGRGFEDWELRLINGIVQDPDLELTAIYRVIGRSQRAKSGSVILRLMLSLEKRLMSALIGAADVTAFPNVPEVYVTGSEIRDRGEPEQPEVLLSHVQSGLPDGDVPPHAEMWGYSIYEDDIAENFAASAVADVAPVTRIELLRLGANGREILQCSTTNTKVFGAFNDAYAKDKLVPVVLRELRLRSQRASVVSRVSTAAEVAQQKPPSSLNYGSRVLKPMLARAVESLAMRFGRPGYDWTLLVGVGDVLTHSLGDLVEISKPDDEFWADPFLFAQAGKTYVFFEAYSFKTRLGRICVGQLIDNGLHDIATIDLGPNHTSYPFVFEHEGEIFMVPEVHQRKRVEVWKSTSFPLKWELHATALEGIAAVDSAILRYKENWWLFTNIGSGRFVDPGQELHVFRIDGPDLKHVEAHAMNPVVIGAAARNGGRLFERGGRLFRPAQVAAYGRYGHGVRINEITELGIDSYSERTVRAFDPDLSSGTSGCHHLDASGSRFILDARRDFPFHLRSHRPIILIASSPSEGARAETTTF